jgi:site-specific DNA-methyltransferase (adenine-specific)
VSIAPYYDDGQITIYHGDCRDVLPVASYSAVVTDAPYGVGIDYASFDDTSENVAELARDVSPYLLSATRAAVFSGVPQMWMWPQPKWVLCWSYAPTTNQFSPWGYAQWQPVLVYGSDPYLAKGLGPRPTVYTNTNTPDRRGNTHPCPKPIEVMRWVVGRVTDEDDVIIDPFMGSGTTLRAAKDLGRRAIGIEREEKYCEIAVKRLSQGVLL